MPLYDYKCACGWSGELYAPIFNRDGQCCLRCGQHLTRQLAAPYGRVAGRVLDGGGPDRFTADALGLHIKDLPNALRTNTRRDEG